ncbi:GHMP kinases C terminal [Fragilaria crotonensis]|nr:GHMP kinases C terminal [Fragilaria crotonensis]
MSAIHSACASAPGKVILFGEHAVVFGEPAVAAALSDLRITVKVTALTSKRVRVRMPDLPTPIDVTFNSLELRLPMLHEPPTKHDTEMIQRCILCQRPSLDAQSVSALVPLIYLTNRLVSSHLETGLDVQIRSHDLPVGAGLGSSAAFGVACAAALWRLAMLTLSLLPHPPLGRPTNEQLEIINKYSFYSEMLLHGTPSGIDNAVSTFAGAIDYTKSDGTTTMEKFDMPPFELILANTHVPRSTKHLVAGVRNLYEQHPNVVRNILTCMGSIARDFRRYHAVLETKSCSQLLTLVRTNQHMLSALGVSHPSLDRICAVVDQVSDGAAAAKLTGAGGGGCAMIVLQRGAESQGTAQKIQDALEKKKHDWRFSCLRSSVGQDGVLWVHPDSVPEMSTSDNGASVLTRTGVTCTAVVISLVAIVLMRNR